MQNDIVPPHAHGATTSKMTDKSFLTLFMS